MSSKKKIGIVIVVAVLAITFMTVAFLTTQTNTDYYLCLKVAPIRGVVTWAEMQFDELPSSVQEKYKE